MNRHLGSRYRRIATRALPLVIAWTATVVATWLLLTEAVGWGAAVAVFVLGLLWWRRTPGTNAVLAAPQVAVVLALGFALGTPPSGPAMLSAAALLLASMAAPVLDPILRPRLEAHQLPGLPMPPLARFRDPLFAGGCAGGVALAAAVARLIPPEVAAAAVWVILVAAVAIAAYQLRRVRRHVPEQEVRAALLAYQPDYYVYFSGRVEAAYQVRMWLPCLERSGTRGALLVRERPFLATAVGSTSMPVLLAESVEPIEATLVPSLGAIYYVNNAARNVDGTRYQQVIHVHLGHGDSDKPASYASSTAMFDRIFVAGQAGVDRFAQHGVLVPREKFVLVGRPQVEAVEVRPSGSPQPSRPVVLYAPTWRGVIRDMQLSSLDSGEKIVSALLAAGAAVIFRPHPFAERDAASRVLVSRIDGLLAAHPSDGHLRSAEAGRMSVFECMNASDALVGDISSVVSDYLYSNKPIALAHHGGADVLAEYPIARGTYLLPVDGDLTAPLRDLLGPDPKAAERAAVRTYYLGPWPADGYADVFVDAVRDAIRDGKARGRIS